MIVQSLVIMMMVIEMIALIMLQGAHLLRCKMSIDDDASSLNFSNSSFLP